MNLFDFRERYPNAPGFKARDTSEAAAEAMKAKAPTLRGRCYDALKKHPAGMTADEVAAHLDEGVLSVRPRVAELAAMALIVDTGLRRENLSGRPAIVWKVPT